MGTAQKGLSVKQELALELILCGMNDGEIAIRRCAWFASRRLTFALIAQQGCHSAVAPQEV